MSATTPPSSSSSSSSAARPSATRRSATSSASGPRSSPPCAPRWTQGTDPADPKLRPLAQRGRELVAMFTGGDPGITDVAQADVGERGPRDGLPRHGRRRGVRLLRQGAGGGGQRVASRASTSSSQAQRERSAAGWCRRCWPQATGDRDDAVLRARRRARRRGRDPGASSTCFDGPALSRAVGEARPDVVVNQLTDLPDAPSPRGMKAAYAANNRARGEGGRNLLSADPRGGRRALRHPERRVLLPADRAAGPARRGHAAVDRRGGELRRGGARGRAGRARGARGRRRRAALRLLRRSRHVVRRRRRGRRARAQAPLPGRSARAPGCTPSSTSTTPRRRPSPPSTRPPGVYNVVDDDPAPTSEWLPGFAAALGAPAPRRVPALPVKLLGGRRARRLAGEPRGREQRARAGRSGGHRGHGSWRTAFRDP